MTEGQKKTIADCKKIKKTHPLWREAEPLKSATLPRKSQKTKWPDLHQGQPPTPTNQGQPPPHQPRTTSNPPKNNIKQLPMLMIPIPWDPHYDPFIEDAPSSPSITKTFEEAFRQVNANLD